MAKLKILLPFIATSVIFLIIFRSFNYREIFDTIKSADIKLLITALIIFLSTPFILAQRWNIILRAQNIKIGYQKILKFYLGSVPISKISPSNSGDLTRAFYLKNKLTLSGNIGIIVLENLFDILSLLLLVLLGSFLLKSAIIAVISLIFILTILGFIIYGPKIKISNEKWRIRTDNFFLTKKIAINNPRLLLVLLAFSLIPWLIIIICIKLLFLAFAVNLPFHIILATQPIVIFLGLLPITFSGVGVRESAMLFLYSTFANDSVVLSVGLIYSISAAIILPLLCLPFLFNVLKSKIKL